MTDTFGEEIFVGSAIAYVVRQGSTMTIKPGVVEHIDKSGVLVCRSVQPNWRSNAVKRVMLRQPDNMIVLRDIPQKFRPYLELPA